MPCRLAVLPGIERGELCCDAIPRDDDRESEKLAFGGSVSSGVTDRIVPEELSVARKADRKFEVLERSIVESLPLPFDRLDSCPSMSSSAKLMPLFDHVHMRTFA